jgi:hypothetical protein
LLAHGAGHNAAVLMLDSRLISAHVLISSLALSAAAVFGINISLSGWPNSCLKLSDA